MQSSQRTFGGISRTKIKAKTQNTQHEHTKDEDFTSFAHFVKGIE